MMTFRHVAVSLLALVMSTGVASAYDFRDYPFYYNINADGESVTVEGYEGGGGEVTIPSYAYEIDYTGGPKKEYSVTAIEDYAFERTGITKVTIANSVTSIGEGAFYGCNKLTSVTIGNSVTSIGAGAFADCNSLTSMIVAEGNSRYDSRDNCNAIIETESNTLIAGCMNTTIPNGVKLIGDFAFFGCNKLTSVTIPNSVTSIGYRAFYECYELTSVTIGNSVTSIGDRAFYYCEGLTKITIPNSVTTIGNRAFADCNKLTSVTIGNSVTSIGGYVFEGCEGLTSVTSLNPYPPSVDGDCLFDYNSTKVYKDKTLYVPTPEKYSSSEPWSYFDQVRNINDKDYYDNDVTTGVYYLQNVATGQYLTAGNAWGTQASLDDTGIDITIEKGYYGYSLNTKIDNRGACYLNIDNGAVYCDQPQDYWFFVKTDDGAYALTMDDENFLAHDGSSTALTLSDNEDDEKAQWRLVTKEERVAAMAGATKDSDATFLLPCANFGRNDTRIGQWEGDPSRDGANTNMNAEKFNTDYDVYQVLENIPNGFYKVKVQGFYREGADENYQITPAEELRRNGEEHLYAQFYANDVSIPVHSIFDGAGQCDYTGKKSEWGYVPNSQADASAYFDKGLYEHEWEVLVTDGTLRIGVRKEAAVSRDWTCFDNFRLFYLGAKKIDISFNINSQKLASNWYANGSMVAYSGFDEMHANHYQPGNADRSGDNSLVEDNKVFVFNLLSGFQNGTVSNGGNQYSGAVDIVFDTGKYSQGISQEGLTGKVYQMTATNDVVSATYNGVTNPVVRLMDAYKGKEGRWVEFQNNDFARDLLNAHPIFNDDGVTTDAFYTEMTIAPKDNIYVTLTGETQFRVRYLRPIDISHVHDGKAYFQDGAEAGYDVLYLADIFQFIDWRHKYPFGYPVYNEEQRKAWMDFYGIHDIYFNREDIETDRNYELQPLSDPNLDLRVERPDEDKRRYDDREMFRNSIGYIRYQNNGGNTGSYNLFVPFHIVHNWGEVILRVQVPVVGTFDSPADIQWISDAVKATSIKLNQDAVTMGIGHQQQLTATVLPVNATNRKVSWKSKDSRVVTVDEDGLVSAIGLGQTEVIATTTDGTNLSASCIVTVLHPGDVNKDGHVNGADIVAVINYVLANSTADGDVNGDGSVNGADIVAVINYVLESASRMANIDE